MARLYADEQFPRPVVENLRALGYDVLTVQEAGNTGLSDEEVLNFAIRENRTVLTLNRRDFFYLHKRNPDHMGIIACSQDSDWTRLTTNIHNSILACDRLQGQVIRVYKIPPPY